MNSSVSYVVSGKEVTGVVALHLEGLHGEIARLRLALEKIRNCRRYEDTAAMATVQSIVDEALGQMHGPLLS